MSNHLTAQLSKTGVLIASKSIIDTFLGEQTPLTMAAYRDDLKDFAHFLGVLDSEFAARCLLSNGQGKANTLVHAYRTDLLSRGLQPATVNRRLAALRSLVKLARITGSINFYLDVEAVKSQKYRDTSGPGFKAVRLIMNELEQKQTRKGKRDFAIVHLLYDLALRRGEIVSLDYADLNLDEGYLAVLGKGCREKEKIALPIETKKALTDWIEARGFEAGPLFINFDPAKKGKRLTGYSIARMVGKFSALVGRKVRPHGFRHSAITDALDITNGNFASVQSFSRHLDPKVLLRYDDNRQDRGAEVAKLLAARVRL
jgi:integrase/recombinase XerC